MAEKLTQMQVDCASGLIAEVVLDEAEAAPIYQMHRETATARAVQLEREAALSRVRAAALADPVLRDLLFVLGMSA